MYQTRIAARLAEILHPDADPRHVEAWMRLEHRTLDHLTPASFNYQIDVALACIDAAGDDESEALARSFAL